MLDTLELFRWLSAASVLSHFYKDVQARAQHYPKGSAPRPWLPRFSGRQCMQSVARILVHAAVKLQRAWRAHRLQALDAARDAVYDRILLGSPSSGSSGRIVLARVTRHSASKGQSLPSRENGKVFQEFVDARADLRRRVVDQRLCASTRSATSTLTRMLPSKSIGSSRRTWIRSQLNRAVAMRRAHNPAAGPLLLDFSS